MLLTQDQEMIRDAVRNFAQEQLWPHAARWDKGHHFPKDVHQGLAELGAYGICVPEELGGAGLDYLTLALVLEEIAAGDGGTSTAISVTNCPYNAILMRYGTLAQQRGAAAQDVAALQRRQPAPVGEAGAGGVGRRVQLGRACQRQAGQRRAVGRVADQALAAAGLGQPLAGHMQRQRGVVGVGGVGQRHGRQAMDRPPP